VRDALEAFSQITLPLMLPAVLAGALLSFSFSLDDTIIFVVRKASRRVSVAVYVFSAVRKRPST